MKVLLLGSGGREHALAWKMSQSPLLDELFIAPGNEGTASIGKNVAIGADDFENIIRFSAEKKIDMIVVGPEGPLANGICDHFLQHDSVKHIPVIGPSKQGAMLESSKSFAKHFSQKYDIPTAHYGSFTADNLSDGLEFLQKLKPPYVLKADGLAAGKGVVIHHRLESAKKELQEMIVGLKFGSASNTVVIEEFLDGKELSLFVLTDGKNYRVLPTAKDYKRAKEGDTGPNTGGMGCISPAPVADKEFMEKVEQRIIIPTINGLLAEKIFYRGFIFFGLMRVGDDPFLIEYNVRLGDPEAEVILPLIKTDILLLFKAVTEGTLSEIEVVADERKAATVMLVSCGYPGDYEKGKIITGVNAVKDSIVFHSGTCIGIGNKVLVTNGGRVFAVTSLGESMKEAVDLSYKNAVKINFFGKYYRRDIGS